MGGVMGEDFIDHQSGIATGRTLPHRDAPDRADRGAGMAYPEAGNGVSGMDRTGKLRAI
jgi:hypothetical protein